MSNYTQHTKTNMHNIFQMLTLNLVLTEDSMFTNYRSTFPYHINMLLSNSRTTQQ